MKVRIVELNNGLFEIHKKVKVFGGWTKVGDWIQNNYVENYLTLESAKDKVSKIRQAILFDLNCEMLNKQKRVVEVIKI